MGGSLVKRRRPKGLNTDYRPRIKQGMVRVRSILAFRDSILAASPCTSITFCGPKAASRSFSTSCPLTFPAPRREELLFITVHNASFITSHTLTFLAPRGAKSRRNGPPLTPSDPLVPYGPPMDPLWTPYGPPMDPLCAPSTCMLALGVHNVGN
eukprot:1192662-Prorocentrum_minimum.AAC.2